MLIDDAPDAILIYEFDRGRFASANKAAERLFGVSRYEIQTWTDALLPAEQPDVRAVASNSNFAVYEGSGGGAAEGEGV